MEFTAEERQEALTFISPPKFYRAAAIETANAYLGIPDAMRAPGGFGALGAIPLVLSMAKILSVRPA